MAHPTDEFYRIAASFVCPLWDGYLEAIRKTLRMASESAINTALGKQLGSFTKALESVEELADILGRNIAEEMLPKMTDAWFAAGRKVSSVLPKSALVQPYVFDTSRVASMSTESGYRALFVEQITREQRRTISHVINQGLAEGWSKAKMAREIRGSIGLTYNQNQWVQNYREQLENMDPAMFDRKLRDRRSDRKLQRLIDTEGSLTPQEIDNLVERYRQRLIQYRAQTIARTEALRAVRQGEFDGLNDAYESGAISPLVRRFWVTCMDERVRRTHTQIPGMNPEGRGMNEPFQTPLGLLRYPMDPNGLPANVINCRCHLEYRMPNADGEYVGRSSSKMPAGLSVLLGD